MYFIHLMLLFSAYVGQPNVPYVSGSRQALKHSTNGNIKLRPTKPLSTYQRKHHLSSWDMQPFSNIIVRDTCEQW